MFRTLMSCCLAAMLVASCAGSDAATSPTAPPLATQVDTIVAAPIEARLGFPSDPARRHYQLLTMQRAADATIVQCMQRAGFFYAVGFNADTFGPGASLGDGSRAWTQVHGLGIASSFAQALASAGDSAVSDPAASNLGYVASLSAEETVAYDLALIGDVDVSATTGSFVPAGCWGESFTEILTLLSLVDRFEPELETLNARLAADPRVQSFEQSWSTCMNEAGHRFANEQALIDEVYARLLRIDISSGAPRTAALDELLSYEQQVGLASFDCRLTFADELAELRSVYERQFLDDNRFVIEDLIGPAA